MQTSDNRTHQDTDSATCPVTTLQSAIAQEREKLEKIIASAKSKLANENFIARAPANIIAKERDKLTELQNQLAALA